MNHLLDFSSWQFPSVGSIDAYLPNEALGNLLLQRIFKVVGHIFDALASIINNANVFGMALKSLRQISISTAYIRTGQIHSESGVLLDKAIGIVSITRMFSDICYLASGEFIFDWKRSRYGLMLGQLALGLSNIISTTLALAKIIDKNLSENPLATKYRCQLVPEQISEAFAIVGFCGHIGDVIWRLCQNQAKNLQDWLDLSATCFSASLPVMALCGVTSTPLLLSFGLLASSFGIGAAMCLHFNGALQSKVIGDFAEEAKDLSKIFGAFNSFVTVLKIGCHKDVLRPFSALASAAKAFSSIHKGVGFINRGKEWFSLDAKGKNLWQKLSIWKIGNRVFLTGHTLMNFYNFLDAVDLIKLGAILSFHIGRIPVFSAVKNLFAFCSAAFALVDNLIKWKKVAKEQKYLASKKLQWETFCQTVEEAQMSTSTAKWQSMQAQMLHIYRLKIQSACAHGNEGSGAKVALWQRHIAHLSSGQLANYLADKQQLFLAKLQQELLAATDVELRAAFQAELNMSQQLSVADFVSYRKALATNNFNHISTSKLKVEWAMASSVFKAALALISVPFSMAEGSLPVLVKNIPTYLKIVHKATSYFFSIIVALIYKLGEKTFLLSSISLVPREPLIMRYPVRYLRAV